LFNRNHHTTGKIGCLSLSKTKNYSNLENTIGEERHSIDFAQIKQSFIIHKYFIGNTGSSKFKTIAEIINGKNLSNNYEDIKELLP